MMRRVIVEKLLHIIPVLLLVTLLTMLMLDLLPGDSVTAILGESATPEQADAAAEALGLNDPLPQRYAEWLGNLVQGDFGRSFRTSEPVLESIVDRVPVTLELAVLAMLMSLLIGVPVAILAALRPGSIGDRATSAGTSMLISSPSFLTALVLVFFLAVTFEIFPPTGWVPLTEDPVENLRRAFLPALTLAVSEIPVIVRVLRTDMIATLQEDYITNARAKGMTTRHIILRHALRPSLFSLVTLTGLMLGRLIGGAVIVENIFALPGIGQYLLQSVLTQDYVAVQGAVVFIALAYVGFNTLVDLSYPLLDPRVRANR